MQRIQNYFTLGTQLLGLAFSERFELNWVVGLFKLGGNREREMGWIVFGVGQLCKKGETAFQVLAPRLMAPIIMSDGARQASEAFMANFVIEHPVMSHITALMAYQKVLMAHHRDYVHTVHCALHRSKRRHIGGCDDTSVNGNCCTQYLVCPNSMGNLQNVNLLTDAKKYFQQV